MNHSICYFATFVCLVLLVGCGTKTIPKQAGKPARQPTQFTGSYVSDDYFRRDKGYDWMAVTVRQTGDSSYHLAIRSRIDTKKPTCTFDADAVVSDSCQLTAGFQGTNILFNFRDSLLQISPQKAEEAGTLSYFCSGGGTIAGTYRSVNELLGKEQLDPRVFQKFLTLQNISFDISTTGEGSIQRLTVQPYGLKTDNSKIVSDVEGFVTEAEMEDLNADGYPELLIYTCSAGSGSYANAIGYSVNNGKSVSMISLPSITDDPKASEGYMGHDQFRIVENSLVRRFQLYRPEDPNSHPTGNIRQIQYKMKEGEASRIFVIEKIVEYPSK